MSGVDHPLSQYRPSSSRAIYQIYRWVYDLPLAVDRNRDGWVLGPGFVALGVAEAGFVLPEDFVPVEASGLDAVFLDQEPTICSRVSRRVWAVQAREWALQRVVDRGGSLEASGHQGLGTLVERWIPAFAGMTRSAPASASAARDVQGSPAGC